MSKTTGFVIFIFGVGIGSVATWRFIKRKHEQITQDEIDSVKEVFYKREVNNTEKADVSFKAKEKPSLIKYAEEIRKHGYTNYSNMKVEEKTEDMNKPYVIVPEDFGEFDDYDKISLTYYADMILADDNDELIEDVDATVGFESLNCFGDYEDDSVFVRNDRLKCDFEILLDQRKYSDVAKKKPRPAEG